MLSSQIPIIVLKEGTRRTSGKDAVRNNINAAKAISDSIHSTLGPKGMDKMLVDSLGDIVITNDGVTILKKIDVEHPAAKMMIEVAKTQDIECHDGTTTATVLAGEFLKLSENLLEQNVHPTIITSGYRMAMERAIEFLNELSETINPEDEENLKNIAVTAMTGKSAEDIKEHLSKIAVQAVKSVMEKDDVKIKIDIDNISLIKKHGGSSADTNLIEGIILDKERVHQGMPKVLNNVRIALINTPLELKKTEISAEIKITSPGQLKSFQDEEGRLIKNMVKSIENAGANMLICQKGIDDLAQYYLTKAGIYGVQRVNESDMKKLSKATGARIINNINELNKDDLGVASVIEEKKIADEDMTFISGCKNAKTVTILIRGGTDHVLDELERTMEDAIGVVGIALEDGKMITGGGATPMELSQHLQDYAATVGGREQLAIEAYAKSIEIIPKTLAENAGLDPVDTLIDLRKAHKKGNRNIGINVRNGMATNMKSLKVIEPIRVMKQAISGATEMAIMILRIDDVIASKGLGNVGNKVSGELD